MGDFIDLSNKTYIITGASSGNGRAVAQLANNFGAKLLLLARNKDAILETAKNMDSNTFMCESIDLTEFEKIETVIKMATEKMGKLNGFCHCAGIEQTLPLRSMNPINYQNLFNINTIAGFELARICSKKVYMSDDGSSFVFIASIMGIVGRPGLIGYSASKGAVIAAVHSMALELAPKHIRVNLVSPGTIMTKMIENALKNMEEDQRNKRLNEYPLGFGTPEDIANIVLFLLSDRSKWITGSNIIIDGGYTAK